MPLRCARKVPLRGAGGVGDPLLAFWVGHGGFGAGGGRGLPSGISARSAFSLSLQTLAPLPVLLLLLLAAHPPVSTTPVPRLFFPHSFCLPPQICAVNCFPLSAFLQSTFNFQLFFNQSFIPFLRRFLPRLAYRPFPTSLTIHSVDRPRAGFDHGR